MKRVVLSKVESIERCIKRIDEIYGGDIKRLNDYLYQDAIVLNIQRACQQSIDLSMYLCSKLAFGIPKSSRDSFVLLKENGIITEKTSNLMEKMVGFRNIVIHGYDGNFVYQEYKKNNKVYYLPQNNKNERLILEKLNKLWKTKYSR